MERKDEIIWVRSDSVTYRIKLGESTYQFCKSFNPLDINNAYPQFFGLGAPQFRSNPLHYDSQRSLYNQEVRLLKALESIGQDFVPVIAGEDPERLQVFMEYLPYPTYQDFLRKTSDEESKRSSIREIVEFLTRVHVYCNDNLSQISTGVSRGGKRLRIRSFEEESSRFERHIEAILLHSGGETAASSTMLSSPTKHDRRQVRKCLESAGIDLSSLVREFIRGDREIAKHKKEFVHGDFRPQNIFYSEDPETHERRGTKICDFDKVRLGLVNDDLATALYNIHTYPFQEEQEQFFRVQATDYFIGRGTPASELPDRLASLVSSYLKSSIKDFGVHCSMDWREMAWFLNDTERARYEQSTSPKEILLHDKFVAHFERFFAYYLAGDGSELIHRASPAVSKVVEKQLHTLEKLFKVGGILPHNSSFHEGQIRATG